VSDSNSAANSTERGVVILGSGMAAWGAHDRFVQDGITPRVFDKRDVPGGHTASYRLPNGFVFDDGPHISFTQIDQVKELFAERVGGEYVAFTAHVDNYYEGHWVTHPAAVNLHGLPTDLVDKVLEDFRAVHGTEPDRIDNYLDWLVATYGRTYAEKFPATYGLKYHTVQAHLMNTDWLGPRLYQPDLDEVVRGATSPEPADVHYIKEFRYPNKGGFQSYLDPFFEEADLHLGHEAVRIDPVDKVVHFANGTAAGYDTLVSSVPLPLLVPMIDGAPQRVLDAAAKLACSQCVLVNIGVDREDLSPAHWRYVYDLDLDAVRLSFPHMFSPEVVPPGHGAIQIEVYFSDKYKPFATGPFGGDTTKVVDTVISNLRTMGVLRDDDNVVFSEGRWVPWANVIFDLDTNAALAEVHPFLDEMGITYCGRYGDWAYIWTDESFMSGWNAADTNLHG
jgi:protoporphyrinogen oxidase